MILIIHQEKHTLPDILSLCKKGGINLTPPQNQMDKKYISENFHIGTHYNTFPYNQSMCRKLI